MKGKPGLRWMYDVEMDLRNMGKQGWRLRALDRREW
jgi:hypothetical protein